MGIDHGRGYFLVSKQILKHLQIAAVLQKMSRKRVAKDIWMDALAYFSPLSGQPERGLKSIWKKMVTPECSVIGFANFAG